MKKTDNKGIADDHWTNNQKDRSNKNHLVLKKRLFSIPEAAEHLALSTWTIRELIWKGELPKVPFGRAIRIDIKDLDALIERNKTREFSFNPTRKFLAKILFFLEFTHFF